MGVNVGSVDRPDLTHGYTRTPSLRVRLPLGLLGKGIIGFG